MGDIFRGDEGEWGGNNAFIFTPMGDEDDDKEGGGGGVKNKGSVAKLLKFKLSLLGGIVVDANVGIPTALPITVGSDDDADDEDDNDDKGIDLVPVVVVVEVLPHIEDNTNAAATVCS